MANDVKSVNEIDWETWVPTESAVLCFIRDKDQVMLIHKKTGLGKGKINAPGGRIEQGETPEQAAIRETQEEIGLTCTDMKEVGKLHFIFTDGYSLRGTVFVTEKYEGELIETYEAKPFWCPIEKIPYDKMWEDDQYWLPEVIHGAYIKGYFIFDNDTMLSRRVEIMK